MRIQVVIPLWKRPEVTRFCFDELLNLMATTKHELRVLCVISESEYIPICDKYGFNWIYADNNPLGAKINKGLRRALEFKWDYLMMMNSDDVIKAELLDKYYDPFFESGEKFFGISKVTYVNFYTNEAREIDYGLSVLGIAKCIKREVVEQLKGELYPADLNKCLDDNMFDRMVQVARVFPKKVKYDGMLAMDFKSETNIWPWEKFKDKGKAVCYNPA